VVLGAPALELELEADRPVAQVAVRHGDVWPDGAVSLVTYAVSNLTHREGHESPRALAPGERYRVRLALNDDAHRFVSGNRVRLALSSSYWPVAWPPPERAALGLYPAGSWIEVPERPPSALDDRLAPFPAPAAARATSTQASVRPPHLVRTVQRDLLTNHLVHRMVSEGGDLELGARVRIDDIDLELGHTMERRFVIDDEDPDSARAEVTERLRLAREGWRIRVDATTTLRGDRDRFLLSARLLARENDVVVFDCAFDEEIPRDLV
jgi:hypothetical protein